MAQTITIIQFRNDAHEELCHFEVPAAVTFDIGQKVKLARTIHPGCEHVWNDEIPLEITGRVWSVVHQFEERYYGTVASVKLIHWIIVTLISIPDIPQEIIDILPPDLRRLFGPNGELPC